ncbi:Arm DNA-binding domain-containing protein [Chitinophaga ginsengisegetis]|uniref:Arm DNA-binding domain-containing protein n=1 Tax=Chitinophaga ginsengisegetis TaxID=393003 RepID=UPI0013563124|nr:DUF3596 domain-containing protein [Chitinophaga ginsengisegetis]
MGQKSKAKKGKISIENNAGRIRLRWRYNGKRYPLNLPHDFTPENMHHATLKVAEIKLDILKGCFDTTLEKYKEEIPKHALKWLNFFSGDFVSERNRFFIKADRIA